MNESRRAFLSSALRAATLGGLVAGTGGLMLRRGKAEACLRPPPGCGQCSLLAECGLPRAADYRNRPRIGGDHVG